MTAETAVVLPLPVEGYVPAQRGEHPEARAQQDDGGGRAASEYGGPPVTGQDPPGGAPRPGGLG